MTGTYQWNASYTGDGSNNPASDNNNTNEQVTISKAGPTITTYPSTATVTLGTSSVTLTDTADLEGGSNPTGAITFTLVAPGGGTVDTETVAVSGSGTYTTPTGFTLPTSGTVTGTYQWNASYSGDNNDDPASSTNDPNERVTVSAASPTLVTTPTPNTLAAGVTLRDTAFLALGYHPIGTITFTLFFNGGSTPVDTETVTVNGNGSYTTPTGFTPGPAGVYQWDAVYSGDANNNTASDVNDPAERVTVTPPALSLTTAPSPATVTLGASSVTLNDTADLEGGVNPTGTITFTLFQGGGTTPVHTETVTVNGNGAYTTPTGFALPNIGTATGTYQWDAAYSGDANNGSVSDNNAADEQVTVSAASPKLATIPTPGTVTLGTTAVTLTDAAQLVNGFHPTGTITFRLFQGGTVLDTETVTVNGNGTYTTPTGFTLPSSGTVRGTYQWDAAYSGDPNNNAASDNNNANEQVTVGVASPTIVTIANPTGNITLGTIAPTLNDTAVVAGGYNPTGTLLFTLKQGGATVFTQSDTVTGNGTYSTAGFTLPTTVTVTGTYTWTVAYSGDGNNNAANDQGGAAEQVTVSAAIPTLATIPTPDTVTLGATSVTLTDTATLAGGYRPTGAITFTLVAPGGGTVDTETVAVNGNGAYTTPTGYTLPTTGTVTGTYRWDASYDGDTNNNAATDNNNTNEQVTVSTASPTITTTPSPTTITLSSATPALLTDSATLVGGYHPSGTITFTLFLGSTLVDTETATVSGNGTYSTPTGYTLPSTGTVTGTYQWDAAYNGDTNNNTVTDNNATNERVTVSTASPTLSTTPSPTSVTLGSTATTLKDSATLAGGYFETGTITFTLFYNGGSSPVDTETVTVSGNGTYTTPTGFTLPSMGTVTGTYQWDATYSGDTNNKPASDTNASNEQVMVSPASPSITTTPSATTVTLGTTAPILKDTATLSGGYFETGSITFTLYYNGGSSPVDTETVTVSGNGTYTTPTGFTLPTTGTVTGTYQWDATYSGDTNNNTVSDNNAANEQVVVSPASPTMTTTPNAATVTLGTSSVTLTDTADLEGAYSPTGTITFTLFLGSTLVHTETVSPVSGNGTYTTPTGYTLPITGTVTGTYQWDATYSGDTNNNAVSDSTNTNERVMVSPASPTITTTAGATVALGSGTYLSDLATLSGSYNGIGSITFYLFAPGVTPDGTNSNNVYSNTMTVSGNGTYETVSGSNPGGYLPTEAGTYQWVVSYTGDGNNHGATSTFTSEPQVVSQVSPTITTTPGATVAIGSGTKLSDSATLSGSYNGTGSITFYLFAPGVTPDGTDSNNVYSNTVTVSGNGTYTTASGSNPGGYLPTATGTYEWVASYGGDSNNDGATSTFTSEPQLVSPASPTITTTPNVTTVTLGTSSVTLKDTADLEGGYSPTGTITFTLFLGSTKLDTETATVSGNGTYTTPTGYLLPTTGTVTGTYQWDASYSGDTSNNTVSDTGATNEQVVVSPANPTITTSPSPTTITLSSATPPLLTDTATLAGGYHEIGTITFTLFWGNDLVDTETATVSGNGTYTTPTGYTLPSTGTATGTYQWDATYNGDTNNNAASDNNNTNERVTVSAASPTLTTNPSPRTITLGDAAPPLLTDTATLAGGYHPSGTITFTLLLGSTVVDTQEATVSGNGTYSTPDGYPLPSTGTVTGTYQWDATYSGDTNNNSVSDSNNTNEQVVVGPASPMITTTPGGTVVVGSGTYLTDSAELSGSYNGTGSITFYLFAPGVTPNGTNSNNVYSDTMTVSGNGTYETVSGSNPGGYLPTEAGTYQWVVSYNGDSNNHGATSTFTTEPQVVSPASPTITTTPNATTVTLGTSSVTLKDTADLEGGYSPTGTITFTLFLGSTKVHTETVSPVSGNGTYTTPTGYALPTTGTVTGTYQWDASYNGDTNNNTVSDTNNSNEQVMVNPASPTLMTTPGGTVALGSGTKLSDSATLAGSYHGTGSITFYLFAPGVTPDGTDSNNVYSNTMTVSGNGTYTTASGNNPGGYLPTEAGTYEWVVSYSGDSNNDGATSTFTSEPQAVSPTSPSITTTPGGTLVIGSGTKLTDAAELSGTNNGTGSITFYLFAPGVTPDGTDSNNIYSNTVTVSGNGTYTTASGSNPGGYLPTATGTYEWVVSYSGDRNNHGATSTFTSEPQVVSPASPTITTTPNVTTVTLGTSSVTLKDTANLEGGYSPTGTITFTLFLGSTLVHTETVSPVSGNGMYTTPTGYALPTAGTVTGTYQWDASYSGDANNNMVSDTGSSDEQVVVSAASPTITTGPSPTTITLSNATPPLLTDTATLAGGYHETGTITFTLFWGNDLVDTETATVSGNGTYTTPTGYTLPPTGTVTGTYRWDATYSGDTNNNTVSDNNNANEQVVVSPANPTIATTPNVTTVTLGTSSVTLKDTADLEGGYSPTGTITFTLFLGSTLVHTETVSPVSGNGTYTTPTGYLLPSSGTVTGTYQWDASYSGDTNNKTVSDTGASNEQVMVSPASPTITTTPGETVVVGSGTKLSDSATLAGSYHGTGSITFYLFAPGVTPDGTNSNNVYSNTMTVSGNGTYETVSGSNPGGYLPTEAGTYQWVVSYTGDGNNHGTTSTFTSEPQVVSPASPTLTTTPGATVVIGSGTKVSDSARLSGSYNGTGSITFYLFAPGVTPDGTDSNNVYSNTVTVSGNGTYTTASGNNPGGYLPTATGTYEWVVSYSGDRNNHGATSTFTSEPQVVSPASPTLATTPSATAVTLGTSSVTLKDTANLEGGYSPTGTITFTLFLGSTKLDTETATVSGNGTYTTPTGYLLPSTGTVTGTYQWDASYSGDTNNNTVSDNNAANEQVVVSPANPTITTTPSPTAVTLGTSSVTLTDTANLEGGYSPTGTITFTLFWGNDLVDTETATVSGNGTYGTPTGYTLPTTSTVTGTYQWDATYNGDTNNNTVRDNNAANEQVVVSPASPTITTSPNVTTVTLGTSSVTLTDTATLAGGYHPSGTITFTLLLGGTLVDTETATVSGNGTYSTPDGYLLPTTSTVTGTYHWDATYSGDGNNLTASDTNEQVTVSKASPTITTSPNPTGITLSSATPPLLTDTATLAGGYHETGTITFTLYLGSTLVDTETATVSGNGTYSTPTGYTLPTTGTVTGTYQWDATYNGDGNNNAVSDTNNASEQVTVSKASPTLSTTPSPKTITLSSATPPLLTDTATLAGGYHETGTITFTLYLGSTLVDTETATVSGNGTYSTPTGYTLPTTGTVTGTYQWDATYNGDGNNNAVSDTNNANEQVTVNKASPTLSTTPSPKTITLSSATPPLLTDTATLAGGYHETGTITFTLFRGSTLVDTETATVSGNGTYTTPTGYTLPTTGTVTGTYQWDASYNGDANNNTVSDNNATNEQVTVSAASPTLSTTPSPTTVTLGTTAPPILTDAATLSGGYHPTGTITFTLYHKGRHAGGHRDGHGQRQRHLHDADRLHAADHRHGHRHLPVGRQLQRRQQQSRGQRQQRRQRAGDGERRQPQAHHYP